LPKCKLDEKKVLFNCYQGQYDGADENPDDQDGVDGFVVGLDQSYKTFYVRIYECS